MYRKIVWCYIIVLTLLDISLNTKLSAQGKSHGNGVSVHESLIEGISLQEWSDGGGAADGGAGVVALAPAALAFGRRALAAAHALTVTVTNTANETIHLASVAGTTPDFHASFFDSKVLASGANTTFSVVFLGRREGPARAHLYIHTSKGVHKYPVSAEGVESAWRVWPLVGLRVPLNATLEPPLTLYNPTDSVVQVTEVYSSAAWLGLALPAHDAGGGAARGALWALPPRAARTLLRLRVRLPPPAAPSPAPPPAAAPAATLHAYIRIKGNMTGGALVLAVSATAAPAGEFLSPAHIRLRTRGSLDKPDTVVVLAGSTAPGGALAARAWGACGRAPPALPPALPPDLPPHNGGARPAADASGVHVTLLRTHIEPYQDMARVAEITLDYGKMWAGYAAGLGNGSGGASNGGASNGGGEAPAQAVYCGGWVTLGRAALPYSLRVLPGTLQVEPQEMHFVLSSAEGRRPRAVLVHNLFPEPVRVTDLHFPPELRDLFITEVLTPLELAPGARGEAGRVRLRDARAAPPRRDALRAEVVLRTNLTDYTLPLLLYDGIFRIEWLEAEAAGAALQLGAVAAGGARSVRVRLHNAGPLPLCARRLAASLPAPHRAALAAAARCAEPAGWLEARLQVRAGAAPGAVRGALRAHSPHGVAEAPLLMRVHTGRLAAAPVLLAPAAPYVLAEAPLELESTMSLRMRLTNVTPAHDEPDAALTFIPDAEAEISPGRSVVGRLRYAGEAHCGSRCATGLDLSSEEGAAWAARGALEDAAALPADAALQRERRARLQDALHNYTLYLHTTEVVQVPVPVRVRVAWPRVLAAGAPRAGLCGVGGSAALDLRVRNPSHAPLLLQPRLSAAPVLLEGDETVERDACVGCVWSGASFSVGGWRAENGSGPEPGRLRLERAEYVVLAPRARLLLTVTFAPAEARPLAAYLYLRNNLTILERVLVTGRGAHPTFELGGRKPNSSAPIVVEVAECGAARRTLVLRNTGRVPLRLRQWRVAGAPCAARALRLQPCAPLRLRPGEARALTLHYRPDWTRTTTRATVSVLLGDAEARFAVVGAAAARLVAACAAAAPRAPYEAALRWAGGALALLAGAACVALAAADAERLLRAHRAARPAPPAAPRPPPLDLRALAAPAEPAASACRARRAPRPRRAAPADPAAERRAFERWRAGVSRRAALPPDDEERSEEEGSPGAKPSPPAPSPPPPALPRGDASSSSPDSSPPPRDSYSGMCCRAGKVEEEEEGSSSSSSSSSPGSGPRARRSPAAWPRGGRRAARPAAAPEHAEHAAPGAARAGRARRDRADTSSPGTGAGSSAAPAPRPARPHARKERAARRRAEPAATAPPPAAPAPDPRPAPRAPSAVSAPPVRWGASWSDVVSRGNAPQPDEGGALSAAPLAPIGSDVRRRLGSHSLFYYGGAPAWPPPPPPAPDAGGAAPAAPAAPSSPTPEERGGGYRSLESLWTGGAEPAAPGAAWLWGGAVRPPPGFSAPRACRPYDPFQSLASIWTPAALDWRLDAGTPPPAQPAPSAPPTPPLPGDAPPN